MPTLATRFELISASTRVDRRALSQAWYDALHLAERDPAAREKSRAVRVSTFLSGVRPEPVGGGAPVASRGWLRAASARRSTTAVAAVSVRLLRREPSVRELAARITARVRRAPAGCGFALTLPQGRVYVRICARAGSMRLYAVCSPALRAAVEAALAHARRSLSSMGVVVGW